MCRQGDEWQSRLDAQFKALRERRGAGRAVFGLEHGLDADETGELGGLVSTWIASSSERTRHWLPVVAHASEVAYAYAGDEYWQSFATRTPGWDHAWRHEVRVAFQRFAREYGGPTPHGRWANWFTIICWPIANAILPKDLQRHLATALQEVSYGLAQRLDDSDALGLFIASHCNEGSERFQQLREQPILLGQIALALLRQQSAPDALVLESTLRRIVEDLESERSARNALRAARAAAARPIIRGAGPAMGVDRHRDDVAEEVEQAARLTSPELLLRRRPGDQAWGARLLLPNLAPIADISPVVREALLSARSWAPAADAPIVPGRLLYDEQELPVTTWPVARTPLVRFQGMAAGLESALLRSWAAPDLPLLFKIRSDATARMVASRAVRPGGAYLYAVANPTPQLDALKVQVGCTGIHVYAINVPSQLEAPAARSLRQMGLLPIQTSAIWPAGTVPLKWDGESEVEWAATDTPMLGFHTDHPLREITLAVGPEMATATSVGADTTLFVALPRLGVGVHEATVREVDDTGARSTRQLSLRVRAPLLRSESRGPLRTWVDPFTRRLDDLWEGTSAVCVGGPVMPITIQVAMATRPGAQPTATVTFATASPLRASEWHSLFATQVTGDSSVEEAYDDARWARVTIDAGRSGTYQLEFERSLPPLRWRLADGARGWQVTLHDDGESHASPAVEFLGFQVPNAPTEVHDVLPLRPFTPAEDGGMYVARRGSEVAAVIVPPRSRVLHDFRQLAYSGQIRAVPANPTSLGTQLGLLANWSRATLPGQPLARAWRARVVQGIHAELMFAMAGRRWAERERQAMRDGRPDVLDTLVREIDSPSPTATRQAREIASNSPRLVQLPMEHRVEALAGLMASANMLAGQAWQPIQQRRGPAARSWAAEFYMRLATDPAVSFWASSSIADGLALAAAWPLPLRVARCMGLAGSLGAAELAGYPPLLKGWEW